MGFESIVNMLAALANVNQLMAAAARFSITYVRLAIDKVDAILGN
jgi:hypothetical protein